MLPRERVDVIKNGRINALEYSRYWAQKQKSLRVRATAI